MHEPVTPRGNRPAERLSARHNTVLPLAEVSFPANPPLAPILALAFRFSWSWVLESLLHYSRYVDPRAAAQTQIARGRRRASEA